MLGLALVALRPVPLRAEPANTLQQLEAEMRACFDAIEAPDGTEVTIVFSLRRDGALFGKPRISHFKSNMGAAAERRLADSVSRAMDRCLPFPITDALGGAIAGRPLSVRIVARNKSSDI
jgi:hypothetical protein